MSCAAICGSVSGTDLWNTCFEILPPLHLYASGLGTADPTNSYVLNLLHWSVAVV
jgi:hypothetical protein